MSNKEQNEDLSYNSLDDTSHPFFIPMGLCLLVLVKSTPSLHNQSIIILASKYTGSAYKVILSNLINIVTNLAKHESETVTNLYRV